MMSKYRRVAGWCLWHKCEIVRRVFSLKYKIVLRHFFFFRNVLSQVQVLHEIQYYEEGEAGSYSYLDNRIRRGF